MSDEKYINAAQQRALRTLLMLAEHDLDGLAPGEIARHLKTLPSNTTRDLANLRLAGGRIARQRSLAHFAATESELAIVLQRNLENARQRLEETRRRYARD